MNGSVKFRKVGAGDEELTGKLAVTSATEFPATPSEIWKSA